MRIRALAHVHTVASRDADLTHEAIRRLAVSRGIRAVLVTEHREALTDRGIAVAAERCRELSDHRVVLVPGLEIVSAERYHLLAFGLTRPLPGLPAEELAGRVREAGALPVLAHPSRYPPGWEAALSAIGAVEVWNRRYDGRLAPDPGALAAWRAAGGARAVFGLDAHGIEALTGALPELLIRVRVPVEEEITAALREGRYETAIAGRPSDPGVRGAGLSRAAGRAGRRLRRAVRRLAGALPIPPEIVTRMGRRW